jgi:hypothetical protein
MKPKGKKRKQAARCVIAAPAKSRLKNTTIVFMDDMLERLDQYVERLDRESPGYNHSRSAVVRMLVTRELDKAEAVEAAHMRASK